MVATADGIMIVAGTIATAVTMVEAGITTVVVRIVEVVVAATTGIAIVITGIKRMRTAVGPADVGTDREAVDHHVTLAAVATPKLRMRTSMRCGHGRWQRRGGLVTMAARKSAQRTQYWRRIVQSRLSSSQQSNLVTE